MRYYFYIFTIFFSLNVQANSISCGIYEGQIVKKSKNLFSLGNNNMNRIWLHTEEEFPLTVGAKLNAVFVIQNECQFNCQAEILYYQNLAYFKDGINKYKLLKSQKCNQ